MRARRWWIAASLLAVPAMGHASSHLPAAPTQLPFAFEVNAGQAPPEVRYLSRGREHTLFLTDGGLVVALAGDDGIADVVRMRLEGAADAPRIDALEPLPGTVNVYRGAPASWVRGAHRYARLHYSEVYPGIDLVVRGDPTTLEYDFVVAPGADLDCIALAFDGVEHIDVDDQGDLILTTSHGQLIQHAPVIYQETDGARRIVDGGYLVADGRVGFAVDHFDPAEPLVIDPVLAYSTFLGGSDWDWPPDLAVDGDGNLILAGHTYSLDFPTLAPAQPTHGGGLYDAFVVKLDPTGSSLVYATFLGGDETEFGRAVAVDSAGNAVVTGSTRSTDFPIVNAPPRAIANSAAFVTKLDPSGAVVFSTVLDGRANDAGMELALDPTDAIYIVGGTGSNDFPVTLGAVKTTLVDQDSDGFAAKLDAAGAILYATYLGGDDIGDPVLSQYRSDTAWAVAVDADGYAYVLGTTTSRDFPTVNPYQPGLGGGRYDAADLFVLKLSPDASTLSYSTYLGTNEVEQASGIDVFPDGSVVIVGNTKSPAFPVTADAVQRVYRTNSFLTGIVTRLSPAGDALVFSTYLGGSALDTANAVTIDPDGNIVVVGHARSTDFALADPLQPTINSSGDGFVSILNGAGNLLLFSTYLGGTDYTDFVDGVAIAPDGSVVIAGTTGSVDFPLVRPLQTSYAGGGYDLFIARLTDLDLTGTVVVPSRGGNTGAVSVAIHTAGLPPFEPGVTVRLERLGEPTRFADPVTRTAGGYSLALTFDLTGATIGLWDVIIESPLETRRLPNGFRVEAGVAPEIRLAIVGPRHLLVGRASNYLLTVTNRGNVDAYAVPVHFDGGPADGQLELLFPIALPILLPGQSPLDWTGVDIATWPGTHQLPLLLPVVPAGRTAQWLIALTEPDPRAFGVSLRTNPALVLGPPLTPPVRDCWGAVVTAEAERALGALLGRTLPGGCAAALGDDVDALLAATIDDAKRQPATGTSAPHSLVRMLTGLIQSVGICADPAFASFTAAELAPYASAAVAAIATTGGCAAVRATDRFVARALAAVTSVDPNDKYSGGVGDEGWVAAGPIGFEIAFENLATATAPAQRVVIEDWLDPNLFDHNTIALGPIRVGTRTVHPPEGRRSFATEIDLRPGIELLLRIEAGMKSQTGKLTWTVTSIDPVTGNPPTDPLIGFLPANLAPPDGQGLVSFTARPHVDRKSGDELTNQASIVFDLNPAIATSFVLNTLDFTNPGSRIDALPAVSGCGFELSWAVLDAHSGIDAVTIWVSENGGPFTPWLDETTATHAPFLGTPGSSYAFYSTCRDRVGNHDLPPATADAVTVIDGNQVPGPVGNTLKAVKTATGVRVHWQPAGDAYDHVLLTDTSPQGSFTTIVDSGRDGDVGIEHVLSGNQDRFYRVAGRSGCGSTGPP